jgi:hypothetical protein
MNRSVLVASAAIAMLGGVVIGVRGAIQGPGSPPPGAAFFDGRGGPRGPGGPGGPGRRDIEVVKQFDKNNDGWLNSTERKPARDYVRSLGFRGGPGRGGPPRGFGRGGERGPAAGGKMLTPADVKTYPGVPFYDEGVLRTVFITFESPEWESELEDFHGTDVDVSATVTIDGKTYRDVGVRYRGLSSYQVPEGRKRSLNLSLDMAHDDQFVGGYRTLNLLNSHEDPTMMRAVLFLHVAREYIPAPKANFARVVINGENWGIYQNVQQFNKEFLKENFNSTDGARWKAPGPNPQASLAWLGESVAPYKQVYEIKSKDDAAQWAALMELCRLLNSESVVREGSALGSALDIDGALRFLALDNALVNNDGYWARASDYSIYRDKAGRFHIIPHDTNEAFASGPGFGPGLRGTGSGGVKLDPLASIDSSKPLRWKLLSTPELRNQYVSYVRDIATNWLDWRKTGPLVERYKTLIEEDVEADTKRLETYEAFVRGTTGNSDSLKTFATERREFLLRKDSRGN